MNTENNLPNVITSPQPFIKTKGFKLFISSALLILLFLIFFLTYRSYYKIDKEQKQSPTLNQQINKLFPNPNPDEKTQIRIIYPSKEASKSSVPLHKPAQIPKTNAISASGSASGFGPALKNIPKP